MHPLLIDLPEKMTTERCVLRPFRHGDGALLFESVQSSRDHLLPTIQFVHEINSPTDAEFKARIFYANWVSRGANMILGLFDRSETRLLGTLGLLRIDWDARFFELGYWVRVDEQGKGLITESVRCLCGLAFSTLSANRVFIRCDAKNVRSANVARRLGFVEEGILLNGERNPDGSIADALCFGMTPTVWQSVSKRDGPPITEAG